MPKNYLCEFVVKKLEKNPITTDREIDGKMVQVIETVSTLADKKFALLKPTRRISVGADIFYAKTVNEMMSKGLMSVHMISKRYDNDGGPYNESETKRIEQIQLRKLEVSAIYFDHKLKFQTSKETKESFNELEKTIFTEMKGLQEELNEIQKPYLSIFSQTAEFKARSYTITWWLFSLLHKYDVSSKDYTPYFEFKDYEKNLDILESIEEGKDEYEKAIIQKALFFISYWVGGGSVELEELSSIENEFDGFTTYHPELEITILNALPVAPAITSEPKNENPSEP